MCNPPDVRSGNDSESFYPGSDCKLIRPATPVLAHKAQHGRSNGLRVEPSIITALGRPDTAVYDHVGDIHPLRVQLA